MAMKFDKVAGAAKKSEIKYYKFEDGENIFRMVGDVLPRYVYWVKNDKKTIPMECLSFDREEEKFTNIVKDHIPEFCPDLKCSWSYLVQVIDPEDGEVKVLGLKKKLFGQIIEMAAKHLGDPTNPETGWTVVVERKKTGPLPFNVEYNLDQMSCKAQPLTEEEKVLIEEAKNIDDLFPVPTPTDQKRFLDSIFNKTNETEEVPDDVKDELKKDDSSFDDDIPF